MENIREFKIIDNYEDFKKYFIQNHDYIQDENPKKQEKDFKYFFKRCLLLITKDDYILELENNPNISKTLLYDDETTTPIKTETYFLNYNININLPYKNLINYIREAERFKQTGGMSGLYDYKGLYFTSNYTNKKRIDFDYLDDKKAFVRYMTQKEQNELIEIIKDLQNKYIEKLKKYYKKYSKRIYISSYWTNK